MASTRSMQMCCDAPGVQQAGRTEHALHLQVGPAAPASLPTGSCLPCRLRPQWRSTGPTWSMKRQACTCRSGTTTSRSGRELPSGPVTSAESEHRRRRQSAWPPTAA